MFLSLFIFVPWVGLFFVFLWALFLDSFLNFLNFLNFLVFLGPCLGSWALPFALVEELPLDLYDHVTPSVPRKFGPLKTDLLPGKPHFSLDASHCGSRRSCVSGQELSAQAGWQRQGSAGRYPCTGERATSVGPLGNDTTGVETDVTGTPPPPDDLPKSRTGRIPKWVVDEAMGRPVEAPGFRSYGAPDPLKSTPDGRRGRARRWLAGISVIVVLAALVVGAQRLGINPLSGPRLAAAKPVNGPTPGLEESSTPLGTPPPMTGAPSASFRFENTRADGVAPVTWSPCRPIHYVIRELHSPPGGRQALLQAIATVAAATGLKFVDDGATDEPPSGQREPYQPERYGDRWAPVLIAWATPEEVPDFGVDIAGEAGAVRVTTPSGDSTYVSGVVYLDPAKYTQIAARSGQAVADSVILHELGHLVGLAHVNDQNQLMWPRGNLAGLTTYQAGDAAGLRSLGSGPCQSDV
ncbi:MAG: matrixin family metalloprotease [Actinomycetales bacterium]|nr:matrixin family metalloprotease [Actinomycetales bacterium]